MIQPKVFARLLGALFLCPLPLLAFDVTECDGDATLGNAATIEGWAAPTLTNIGNVLLDNKGSPNSGLGAGTVIADWNAAIATWDNITQNTMSFPTPAQGDITSVQLGSSVASGDSLRLMIVIQPNTQSTSGGNTQTGWAAITSTDPSSFLGLTFSNFITSQSSSSFRKFVDADILINDDPTPAGAHYFSRSSQPAQAGLFDLQGIMAHELGHFLGADHSNTSGALMEATAADGVLLNLAVDDVNFLRFVYPDGTIANPPQPARNDTTLTSCTSVAVTGGGGGGTTVIDPGSGSSGGGCRVGGPDRAGDFFLSLFGLFLALGWTRARPERVR